LLLAVELRVYAEIRVGVGAPRKGVDSREFDVLHRKLASDVEVGVNVVHIDHGLAVSSSEVNARSNKAGLISKSEFRA